ncbi:MAG: hypothetical protein ABIJ34_02595 [archaeon]
MADMGIIDMIKEGLGHIFQILSASIFSPILEGTEIVMKNIEDRIMRIERRILRKLRSFLVIGFGAALLTIAFLFFLVEFLGWSKAAAFFSAGIIVFVIGLLLKLGESNK